MELDILDYLKDPLEGVNIWPTLHSTSEGMLPYYCDLTDTVARISLISEPSISMVTFSEPPLVWRYPLPLLSLPPHLNLWLTILALNLYMIPRITLLPLCLQVP